MRLFFFISVISFTALAQDINNTEIIQNSRASYPGNCPCPYSITVSGSKCGKRSAYSKPGGYAPICYPENVTPAMISSYKHKHGIRQ